MNRTLFIQKIKRTAQTLALLLSVNMPGTGIAAINADSVTSASTTVEFAAADTISATITPEQQLEAGSYSGFVARAKVTCSACLPYDSIVYRWTPGSGYKPGHHRPGEYIIRGSNPDNRLVVMMPAALRWDNDWFSYDKSTGIIVTTHNLYGYLVADVYRLSLDVAIWK